MKDWLKNVQWCHNQFMPSAQVHTGQKNRLLTALSFLSIDEYYPLLKE